MRFAGSARPIARHRRAHPLLGLADRLVGQPDEVEGGQPGAIWTCTSTGSTSMPWNATVRTFACMLFSETNREQS